MSDQAAAPKDLQRVVELLPPGKVPGGFAREFCLIFRPEILARFGKAPASPAGKPIARGK